MRLRIPSKFLFKVKPLLFFCQKVKPYYADPVGHHRWLFEALGASFLGYTLIFEFVKINGVSSS